MARAKNDGKGRLGGRTKGTPNKITCDLREWVAILIDGNREQIAEDLKQMQPKDRVLVFERLLGYILPKMQSIESDIRFEDMTESQIDGIIDKIKRGVQND